MITSIVFELGIIALISLWKPMRDSLLQLVYIIPGLISLMLSVSVYLTARQTHLSWFSAQ